MDNQKIKERFERETYYTVDGCWIFFGAGRGRTFATQYGTITMNNEVILAHRWSYEFHKGAAAEGLQVQHTCNRSRCWNPAHLVAGTPQENTKHMYASGRGRTGLCKPTSIGEEDYLWLVRESQKYIAGKADHSPEEIAQELGWTVERVENFITKLQGGADVDVKVVKRRYGPRPFRFKGGT